MTHTFICRCLKKDHDLYPHITKANCLRFLTHYTTLFPFGYIMKILKTQKCTFYTSAVRTTPFPNMNISVGTSVLYSECSESLFLRPATWISCLFILSPYRKKCRYLSNNRPQIFPSTFITITLPFGFYFIISNWSFYFTRVKAFFLENSRKSRNDSCYKQILSHSYNPLNTNWKYESLHCSRQPKELGISLFERHPGFFFLSVW